MLQHDENTKKSILKPLYPGQNVRVLNNKTHLWTPARIVERCQEPRSYIVASPNGQTIRRNRAHLRELESADNNQQTADNNNATQETPIPNTPQIERTVRFANPPSPDPHTHPTTQSQIQSQNSNPKSPSKTSPKRTGQMRKTRSGRVSRQPETFMAGFN